MDKARICVNQVKNVTKKKSIKEGQKLLVYEKARKRPEQKVKKIYNLGNNNPPLVKKIRVCTGAELKKACPRTPPCKPPPPPDDSLALIARLLWFAIKAGIAGGLIFLTYQAGVWGDNDDTQALWERACAYFSPKSKEDEEDLEQDTKIVLGYCNQNKIFMEEMERDTSCPLPTDDSNLYYIQRKWNEFVIEIGDVIMAGPVTWASDFGNWLTQSDEPDAEEGKRRAKELLDKKTAVEEYNIRVQRYEEKKVKEREERIIELKKRYNKRLRAMQRQREDEYGLPPTDVEEEAEEETTTVPQSACSS